MKKKLQKASCVHDKKKSYKRLYSTLQQRTPGRKSEESSDECSLIEGFSQFGRFWTCYWTNNLFCGAILWQWRLLLWSMSLLWPHDLHTPFPISNQQGTATYRRTSDQEEKKEEEEEALRMDLLLLLRYGLLFCWKCGVSGELVRSMAELVRPGGREEVQLEGSFTVANWEEEAAKGIVVANSFHWNGIECNTAFFGAVHSIPQDEQQQKCQASWEVALSIYII